MPKRILFCLALLALTLTAQAAQDEAPLRVGITEVPPFVMKTGDGR